MSITHTLTQYFLVYDDVEIPARTLEEADAIAKAYLTIGALERIDVFLDITKKLVARYDKEYDGSISVWRR